MTTRAIKSADVIVPLKVLVAARDLLQDDLEMEITSYSISETKMRVGSIEQHGWFFNPDTIHEVDALRSVRKLQRIIKQIDAVLADPRSLT